MMTMNTTRAKRGVVGRRRSKNGVGKKLRRILEPASREEVQLYANSVILPASDGKSP